MNITTRIIIVVAVVAAAALAFVAKQSKSTSPAVPAKADAMAATAQSPGANATGAPAAGAKVKLPRLVDLGAGKCIPCKMMKHILDDLKANYTDHFSTEFIDVWEKPDAGKQYGIEVIPTQIFYNAEGKELFRHVGFYGKEDILGKWKELGVDMETKSAAGMVRETPVAADTRPRDAVCFMCDGDVSAKTKTVVKGATAQRLLCSPHCYFIFFSSLVGVDAKAEEAKVSVTDWTSGSLIPAPSAAYLYGMDASGRPTVKAFADQTAAVKEQQISAGNVVTWDVLRSKELATRCAFCDRAVYPEDACGVKFGSTHGHGCCTHCSLGVAARFHQDIEVEAKDGFSGELIRIKTLNGSVAALEPASAIAWFGQNKNAEGKWVSAGCFKQGFFVSEANLQKWLDARPAMTGRQISIAQALADKMKLTPQQIAKACKLGECN